MHEAAGNLPLAAAHHAVARLLSPDEVRSGTVPGPTAAVPVQDMAIHLRRLLLERPGVNVTPDEGTALLASQADAARDRRAWADAADLYEAALSGQAGFSHLHVQCGHMNKEAGRLADAERHYLIAQTQMPGDEDLALQLGHFYKVAGRPADALLAFERASELREDWQESEREIAALTVQSTDDDWIRGLQDVRQSPQPPRTTTSDDGDPEPGLLSFITTVWDTPPAAFGPLIESVLAQRHQGFEWVLLDNGSSRPDTLAMIEALKSHPFVTVRRVEQNLGITRGMHAVLAHARNRYVVPLDSDDLLTPDCVGLTTTFLRRAGYPLLAYTDEDRVKGETHLEPFCKPDWDPVLFFHSCYIAHLCLIDRQAALDLGAYTDPSTNGSHDWDTFTRFYLAGHQPAHIPHIVYSWRIHPHSSAGNMAAKDYIASSHRTVLGRLIAAQSVPDDYRLIPSPLFQDGVDWRFSKTRRAFQFTTIKLDATGPVDWPRLAALADAAADQGQLVHLLDPAVTVDGPDWQNEAETLLSLFKDTAVVGGFLHRGGRLVAADSYFAFADGARSPNLGRLIVDAGYFGQAWKPHSCDAVPPQHCIVRPEILSKTCRLLEGTGATLPGLGLWLGRVATRHDARVVFSPMIRAKVTARTEPSLPERKAHAAIQRAKPAGRGWPRQLGRIPTTAFLPIDAVARQDEDRLFDTIGSVDRTDAAAWPLVERFLAEP